MGYTREDIEAMNGFLSMSDEDKINAFENARGNIQTKARSLNLGPAQAAFEKHFGADQNRTPTQWRNLVAKYGIATVCEKEGMDANNVSQRMNESFTAYYKRMLKQKRANV